MGDPLGHVVIKDLEPWDFVVLAGTEVMNPADAARHSNELRNADVPGLKPWMLCVPRRWYN